MQYLGLLIAKAYIFSPFSFIRILGFGWYLLFGNDKKDYEHFDSRLWRCFDAPESIYNEMYVKNKPKYNIDYSFYNIITIE